MGARPFSRFVGLIAATAAVLGSGALAATGAVSAPAAQPRTGSGGWSQLSTGTVDSIQNIGLARFGSTVQAVWVEDDGGGKQSLHTRIVGDDGTPVGAPVTVQSGWSNLNNYPAIISSGGQRLIAFSGLQDTNTKNPYSQGNEYLLTSSDGTSWTLSQGALSEHLAYRSDGSDAVDANGTPVVGYTDGAANSISYHSGLISAIPPTTTTATDPTTTPATKCCAYYTGLGYDATAGQTWAVWYSNSGVAATNGILAQPIEPTLGTQSQGPGSNTVFEESSHALDPAQRIVTADRVGGGVYAAYVVGFPTAAKLALWKLGSSTAIDEGAGGQVKLVGTAAAPDGRIWLYWWNSSTNTIEAARTNPAATQIGAVCQVPTPAGSNALWKLSGNAGDGPLQLFALAGNGNPQFYDSVVQPCLDVTVSPATVARNRSFTVTVTDAGTGIKGARVAFDGVTKHTSVSGKTSFTVAKKHPTGKFPVSVREAGYQVGSATVRVTAR